MHKSRLITPSTLLWLIGAGLVTLSPTQALAIGPFVDASTVLTNDELSSGVAIAIEDMNGDCLDDIIRLRDGWSLEIEYQQDDGTYTMYEFGSVEGESWALAIADIDGNGYNDIFTGGAYDGRKILMANDDGTDYELSFIDNGPFVFVQCTNFADINNDGNLDLFICNDDGISSPYRGDGTGDFTYDLEMINPESTAPAVSQNSTDDSGNYGTVWTDYDNDGDLDLYIAKCRQGVENPDDGRRINQLFQNDGSNNYTDVAVESGLVPKGQSWAVDFADFDNDGDFDAFLINHYESPGMGEPGVHSIMYENMGPENIGIFEDVTAATGIEQEIEDLEAAIQTHFEDFDNDTFVDFIVTTRTGVHALFMGNGDGTFTEEGDAFPTGGLGIQSAVVGDLDNDGFPDLLAGFATGFNSPSEDNPDKVFLNPGNENNWFNIRLEGVESNRSAVGARLELKGAWGTQIREVRAGESYGINNSMTQHFGLGTADTIESLTIRWPSGHVDTAMNPAINQVVHIIEGCEGLYYADTDNDGFGDPDAGAPMCLPSDGYVADDTDCDDDEDAAYPGNEEVCDGIDNDCNDEIDDGLECEPEETGEETGMDATDTMDTMDTTETGSGTETGDEDSGQNDSGDGGCACSATPCGGQAWMGLALFGLLGLTRRRR